MSLAWFFLSRNRHGDARRSSKEAGLRRARFLLLGCAMLLALVVPATAAAELGAPRALEYPSASGYVFGRSLDADGAVLGFVVTDEAGIAFWSGYRALGGRAALGPAISHRYQCDESVCQVFERALLRWDPATMQAHPVEVLSYLHHTGKDDLLARDLRIPPPWDWQARDAGKEWTEALAEHEGLYAASAGLAEMRDVLGASRQTVIGLPMAIEQGPAGTTVLRGTRAAVVDAGVGGPTYVLGAGQIAVAAGMVPEWALHARAMPASVALPPSRLSIPKMGLDAPLLHLAPEEDGSLPAPEQPEDVAWYTDSARLGEGGNALVAAHVDWVGRTAAFRNLETMVPGDEVWLFDEAGASIHYRVVEAGRYPTSSGLLRRYMANPGRGEHTLTLVTCGGPFDVRTRTYLERFVVRAVQVEPSAEAPP